MFSRILFPTDFSDISLVAGDYARTIASRWGSVLHALHVVHQFAAVSADLQHPFTLAIDIIPDLCRQADERMKQLSDQYESTSPPCQLIRTTVVGDPIGEILNYAKNNEIDLIVMGTHGRNGFFDHILGSVAEKTVRYSPCPVLTVCPPHLRPPKA